MDFFFDLYKMGQLYQSVKWSWHYKDMERDSEDSTSLRSAGLCCGRRHPWREMLTTCAPKVIADDTCTFQIFSESVLDYE